MVGFVKTLTDFTVTELTSMSGAAAVAFVKLALWIVIRIITEAVTQVAVDTSSSIVFGVLAQTVVAVCGDNFSSAAVTTVPVATVLVVAVIASAVALVFWQNTFTVDFFASGVTAMAFFTESELLLVCFLVVTAIAAIPAAMLVVVVVVAVVVL